MPCAFATRPTAAASYTLPAPCAFQCAGGMAAVSLAAIACDDSAVHAPQRVMRPARACPGSAEPCTATWNYSQQSLQPAVAAWARAECSQGRALARGALQLTANAAAPSAQPCAEASAGTRRTTVGGYVGQHYQRRPPDARGDHMLQGRCVYVAQLIFWHDLQLHTRALDSLHSCTVGPAGHHGSSGWQHQPATRPAGAWCAQRALLGVLEPSGAAAGLSFCLPPTCK